MIDNKTMKGSTRFVVVREFTGSQSMEDVFGALVERQANDNYERWKSDHGGGGYTESLPLGSEDNSLRNDMVDSDNVADCGMDIVTPMTTEAIQTA